MKQTDIIHQLPCGCICRRVQGSYDWERCQAAETLWQAFLKDSNLKKRNEYFEHFENKPEYEPKKEENTQKGESKEKIKKRPHSAPNTLF